MPLYCHAARSCVVWLATVASHSLSSRFLGVVGILGYHVLEGLAWIDALLNAAMILGGMGPVDEVHTAAGKIFAAFYALYSGLIVLVVAGVLFAPLLHRFLHRFHLELSDDKDKPRRKAGK
jgi:hypothetical protein